MDSRGIPGWDRVDRLARALLSLSGICVTNSQAREIQKLYEDLTPYDKRPLQYDLRPQLPSRGRFGRSKRSSHVGVDHMKK